ncbi:MAG: hypothetical protein M1817_002458 [Caeruleum heppii]|nr:MAG: hypothetical protein M1817_002458 [Caeruleum heppii]
MPIARTNGLETKDWNNNEHFYRYTSGRWLYGEEEQLSRRYVKFNMKELARIASQAVGSSPCMDIVKLPEGNFNKTFLMTMDDGKQVVARVPNPNAGQAHYTTASEVATMDFVGRLEFGDFQTITRSNILIGKEHPGTPRSQSPHMEL